MKTVITILTILTALAFVRCGSPTTDAKQTEQPVAVDHTATKNAPFRIERLSPKLDRFIAPGTLPEQIASGYNWAEGPCWVGSAEEGYLVWSDVPE
ncbi:MAG: hypothetical protein AAF597_16100, partial [Bacteroidota bacterium]